MKKISLFKTILVMVISAVLLCGGSIYSFTAESADFSGTMYSGYSLTSSEKKERYLLPSKLLANFRLKELIPMSEFRVESLH